MKAWTGIKRDTSPVDDNPGASEYQANTRMLKGGELQRRSGMLSTAIAQQAGAIYEIMSANGLGNNFLTFDLSGSAGGFSSGGSVDVFPPPPVGPKRRRPKGAGGTPVAPTIVSVSASPPSPKAYQAGAVVFTPTITYDGLSGALSYSWVQTVGPAAPSPASSALAIYSTNFDAFCIPGLYTFTLTITTALNGFSNGPFPFNFTVT